MSDIHARWDVVMELFGDAMDATPDDREQMLSERAVLDADVVAEVRSLLASHDSIGDRFEKPALAILDDGAGEWLNHPTPTLAGQLVGNYEVVRKIGEGGMGAVYEATRAGDAYQQRVALKTISRGADSQTIVERFRRERRILASLQHPNIAAMYDGGVTSAGTPYLVMEYVDGLTIDAWCAQHQLTVAQRLDLFRQVCGAVQHAHRKLVVHRDIKPGNVLVSNEGVVKLLDFGIAKLVTVDSDGTSSDPSVTRDGMTPLSTAYASPEQVRGDAVSTATDVYSLGVVLYQLLCGVAPFQIVGKTPVQVLASIVEETPLLPSVACTDDAARNCRLADKGRLSKMLSGELDAIVSMAMRKEPERRYASVDALADDIHRYLKGLPVSARPDTLGYRARKFVERRRALVGMSALMIVATAMFGVVSYMQSRSARKEAARTLRISNFMQSVLGAADVTGGGTSMPRVGPRATVSALLDSALKRVAQEFPEDPAVRARLYTTIGSGLFAQTRLREASVVLDSAIALSKLGYGENSPEFATACNEAGLTALHRNRLAEAAQLMNTAKHALETSNLTRTEIYSQTYVNLAGVALVSGDYQLMDSLARHGLDLENKRTPRPTMAKAGALNRIAGRAATLGKVGDSDSLYVRALAMLDSLHAAASIERLDIMNGRASLAMTRGTFAVAESMFIAGEQLAVNMIGPETREHGLFLAGHSMARLFLGDTVMGRQLSEHAVRILKSIPEMVTPVASNIRFASASYYSVAQRWHEADSVLTETVNSLQGLDRGMHLIESLLYQASARGMIHDLYGTEESLLRAQRVYRNTNVVQPYYEEQLNILFASVYTRLGRTADAERYYPLVKPEILTAMKAYAVREHAADSAAMAKARH